MAGQPVENFLDRPVAAPLLKPPVAGLIRWIAWRQIFPRCPRTEHPQGAVENVSRVTPRAAPAIRTDLGFRNERFDELPLLFGEVHAIPCVGGG